ncbi:hypothetical protein EBU94_03455 [bacterium]|nr:hypothetical protein [bacterium]
MALDLANGYVRKDGSSASNVYYGYALSQNPADGDFVYSIRRVTTAAGVETISWTNGDPNGFISSWSGRTFSFAAPATSIGLTWSTSGYTTTLSWSAINGVNKYFVTVRDSSNQLLGESGYPQQGSDSNQSYTKFVNNSTSWTQRFVQGGTYSITLEGRNIAGSTTSTGSVYITPTTVTINSAQYYGHNR